MTQCPGWRSSICFCLGLLLVGGLIPLRTGALGPEAGKTQQVPVVDAEAGPCSVEVNVTDVAGKPVYAATIRVHVSHGFLGIRKTDLEIGTNAEGEAKFIGLPQDRGEVLKFRASKGRQKGTALADPAKNCQAKHFIVLR